MNGNARMTASGQSMAGLAEMLSGQLDLPVVDMTGLTGKYDFTLYFSPEGLAGMRLPGGLLRRLLRLQAKEDRECRRRARRTANPVPVSLPPFRSSSG